MAGFSFRNWRVIVPVAVLLAALLSLYGRILIRDIELTRERYVRANAVFLDYLYQTRQKEYRDCRLATAKDLESRQGFVPSLSEGDTLLVSSDSTTDYFPMAQYVRELQDSPHRTELEERLREADLSIYSLPTRSCANWNQVLELYDSRNRAQAGPSKKL